MSAVTKTPLLYRSLRLLHRQPHALLPVRSMAAGVFDDKEKGEERVWFKKEEARLLRDLLAKTNAQINKADNGGSDAADKEALKKILGKYNVSDADLTALINWKHGQ